LVTKKSCAVLKMPTIFKINYSNINDNNNTDDTGVQEDSP